MTLDRPLREEWRNALVYVWYFCAMDKSSLPGERLERIKELVDVASAELEREVMARHRAPDTAAGRRCPVCEGER